MQVSTYFSAGIAAVLAILLAVSGTGWTDPSGDLNDPFEYKMFDVSSHDVDSSRTTFYSAGGHSSFEESLSASDNVEDEDYLRNRLEESDFEFTQDSPGDVDAEWISDFVKAKEPGEDHLLTGFDLLQEMYDNGEYDPAWSLVDVVNQVGEIAEKNLTKFSSYNFDSSPSWAGHYFDSVAMESGASEEESTFQEEIREAGGVEMSLDKEDVLSAFEHDSSELDEESVEDRYRNARVNTQKLTVMMTDEGHVYEGDDHEDVQDPMAEHWSTFSDSEMDNEVDEGGILSESFVEEARPKPEIFGFEKYSTQVELTKDDAAFFSQQINFEDF